MVPRIRELLHAAPFDAFKVRTSDGREYFVPTADHAAVHPRGTYVLIFGDDESTAKISRLHVAALFEGNGKTNK